MVAWQTNGWLNWAPLHPLFRLDLGHLTPNSPVYGKHRSGLFSDVSNSRVSFSQDPKYATYCVALTYCPLFEQMASYMQSTLFYYRYYFIQPPNVTGKETFKYT